MGVPGEQFCTIHKDKIDEIKQILLDYVKYLKQCDMAAVPENVRPAVEDLDIPITEDGYPHIPVTIEIERLHKAKLDKLMRMYLSRHYRASNDDIQIELTHSWNMLELASRKNYVVPYRALETNTHQFINDECLPAKFGIKEPTKMAKEQIVKFLTHIIHRQQLVGVEDSFRFRLFINKKGEHPAEYLKSQVNQTQTKRRTKAKTQEKEKEAGDLPSRVADRTQHDHGTVIIQHSNIDPALLVDNQATVMSRDNQANGTAKGQQTRSTAKEKYTRGTARSQQTNGTASNNQANHMARDQHTHIDNHASTLGTGLITRSMARASQNA